MFKILETYLSKYYKIYKNKDGYYIISLPSVQSNEIVYWNNLLIELKIIFSLNEEPLKKYVLKWANVDLTFYFGIIPPFIPNVTNVVSGLLTQDLLPISNLFYIDFRYSGDT